MSRWELCISFSSLVGGDLVGDDLVGEYRTRPGVELGAGIEALCGFDILDISVVHTTRYTTIGWTAGQLTALCTIRE